MVRGALLAATTATVPSAALALEAETELAASGDFVFATGDVQHAFADDAVRVGAGYALVSDWRHARHGARALVGAELAGIEASLVMSWAPAQDRLGWLGAELSLERSARLGEHVVLELQGTAALRRADVESLRGRVLSVEKLHLLLSPLLIVDGRWRFGLLAAASFYDVDLARPGLLGVEAGLLVAIASRPERWALGARVGHTLGARCALEIGVTAIGFADGSEGAVLPRAAVRAGPLGWLTVEIAGELVVRGPTAPGLVGSLALELAR